MSFELAEPSRARSGPTGSGSGPRAAATAAVRDQQPRFPGLGARLRAPIQIVVVALLLSAADWGYTQKTGDLLSVAGVRPLWIAGPLALLGVGLSVWRFIAALD